MSDQNLRGKRTDIPHLEAKFFEYEYEAADNLSRLSENGSSVTLAAIVLDGEARLRFTR